MLTAYSITGTLMPDPKSNTGPVRVEVRRECIALDEDSAAARVAEEVRAYHGWVGVRWSHGPIVRMAGEPYESQDD